jgi:hypothetical protein
MITKEFRNLVARFVVTTVAVGSIFGGVALGMATDANASPAVQAQTQQTQAMGSKTDPGARVPTQESAPAPQRRVAVPGEAPRHQHRKSGEM